MYKLLEQCYYYNELEEYAFSADYLEMLEYTLQAFNDGLIVEADGDYSISDMTAVDMAKVDLDALRWSTGAITTEELYKAYREFYVRAGS